MAYQRRECPKCKAGSELGFVLDRGHMNTTHVATWVDGPWVEPTPLKKLFSDLLQGKRQRPISGYRCTSCGYLEFFANDEPTAS